MPGQRRPPTWRRRDPGARAPPPPSFGAQAYRQAGRGTVEMALSSRCAARPAGRLPLLGERRFLSLGGARRWNRYAMPASSAPHTPARSLPPRVTTGRDVLPALRLVAAGHAPADVAARLGCTVVDVLR